MNVLYIGTREAKFRAFSMAKASSITFCTNGVEAVSVLSYQNSIDAIICEYHLSGNDGIYLYNQFKNEKKNTHLPFVLLVEEYNFNTYTKAFENGLDDYFVIGTTAVEHIWKRLRHLVEHRHQLIVEKVNATPKAYKFPLSKRIFDVIVASLILIFISPLLLLTALAIRLESKGKVYYIAKRVGNRIFDFYKLRSMKSDTDKLLSQLAKEKNQYDSCKGENKVDTKAYACPRCKTLPVAEFCSPLRYAENKKVCEYWYSHQLKVNRENTPRFVKILDDPRITKIGKIIRNTSIDELPQLINVIKGDMSLVGNRPLPLYEAEHLTQDQMSKRFLAPAGITGLWQVELRGKGGNMSVEERIALDNRYADYFAENRYSLWFDLKILLKTIPALFQKSSV